MGHAPLASRRAQLLGGGEALHDHGVQAEEVEGVHAAVVDGGAWAAAICVGSLAVTRRARVGGLHRVGLQDGATPGQADDEGDAAGVGVGAADVLHGADAIWRDDCGTHRHTHAAHRHGTKHGQHGAAEGAAHTNTQRTRCANVDLLAAAGLAERPARREAEHALHEGSPQACHALLVVVGVQLVHRVRHDVGNVLMHAGVWVLHDQVGRAGAGLSLGIGAGADVRQHVLAGHGLLVGLLEVEAAVVQRLVVVALQHLLPVLVQLRLHLLPLRVLLLQALEDDGDGTRRVAAQKLRVQETPIATAP